MHTLKTRDPLAIHLSHEQQYLKIIVPGFWFLEKKYKITNKNSLFNNYLSLQKGTCSTLQVNKLYLYGCFEPNLVDIGPVILMKRIFKIYQLVNHSSFCYYFLFEKVHVYWLCSFI